jgi:imidazole glycerol-phosphate synthase subunit HisF
MKKGKNFRFISRLDIKDQHVIKSINFEGLRKVGLAKDFALKYYNENIDEIFYIDAVSSLFNKKFVRNFLQMACEKIRVPVTVGGGIKNADQAKKILKSGADKIAINTAAVKSPDLLKKLSDLIGSQSVVSYIEAKKNESNKTWEVCINNGKENTGIDVMRWVEIVQKKGAGELLVTSVDKEGTEKGFENDLYSKLSKNVDVPMIASGGCGKIKDILEISKNICVDGIAISSVLHFDKLKINEIKKFFKNKNFNIRY